MLGTDETSRRPNELLVILQTPKKSDKVELTAPNKRKKRTRAYSY